MQPKRGHEYPHEFLKSQRINLRSETNEMQRKVIFRYSMLKHSGESLLEAL